MSLEELEAFRAALVRAQRKENTCIRELSEFMQQSLSNRSGFRDLLAKCRACRVETVAPYDAWIKAAERAGEPAAPKHEVDGRPLDMAWKWVRAADALHVAKQSPDAAGDAIEIVRVAAWLLAEKYSGCTADVLS